MVWSANNRMLQQLSGCLRVPDQLLRAQKSWSWAADLLWEGQGCSQSTVALDMTTNPKQGPSEPFSSSKSPDSSSQAKDSNTWARRHWENVPWVSKEHRWNSSSWECSVLPANPSEGWQCHPAWAQSLSLKTSSLWDRTISVLPTVW